MRASAVPRPAPRATPLVGRDDTVAAAVAALRSDTPRAVVAGAPGTGRTAVLDAVGDLEEGCCAVLRVRGTETGRRYPLGAFAAVLHASDVDSPADAPLTFVAWAVTQVRRHARAGRLLVTVDDAHLLDDTSALLVDALLDVPGVGVAVSLVDGAGGPDALTRLRRTATTVETRPLDAGGVRLVAEQVLGGGVTTRTTARLTALSEGNPALLREILHGASRAGSLTHIGGSIDLGDLHATEGITAHVTRRVARVDPAARDLLDLLALGAPLPLPALEAADPGGALEQLEHDGLIVVDAAGGGRYDVVLAGGPLATVLREQVGVVRSRRLRRQLADLVEQHAPDRHETPLRTAYWRLDAGVDQSPETLAEAAGLAAQALDHRLAVRLAEAAHDRGAGWRALLTAALSHRELGEFVPAAAQLRAIEAEASGSEHAARYLYARCGVEWYGLGWFDEHRALIDRAEHWRDDRAWRDLIRLVRLHMPSTTGQHLETVARSRAMLAEPDLAVGIRLPVAMCLLVAAVVTGASREGLDVFAAVTAEAGGRVDLEWPPEALAGLMATLCGRWATHGEGPVAALRARARRGHDAFATAAADLAAGAARLDHGDLDGAERSLGDALVTLDAGNRTVAAAIAWGCLATVQAAGGRADAARLSLQRARTLAGDVERALEQPVLVVATAWVTAVGGDPAAAQRHLLDAAGRVTTEAPLLAALWLHEAHRLGAPARSLVGRLAPLAGRTDSPRAAAALAHVRAAADGDGPGLLAAAEAFAAIGHLLDAAECAQAAVTALERAGATAAAERARVLRDRWAAACPGARTPGLAAGDAAPTLTRREREIALLAAQGRSNAGIAEHLVLSVRTVESHLYRVMAKLDLGCRADLAAVLAPEAATRFAATTLRTSVPARPRGTQALAQMQ